MSSITVWARLEPQSREPTTASSLPTAVRDPLWMLARQWQVGEFMGRDAGSPIDAAFETECSILDTYAPTPGGPAPSVLDSTVPLEAVAEPQAVRLGLRGSIQLGVRFEEYLASAAPSGSPIPAATLKTLRTQAWPIDSHTPPTEAPDRRSGVLRSIVAGQVVDGVKLVEELVAAQYPSAPPASQPASLPAGVVTALGTAYTNLLKLHSQTYTEAQNDAWSTYDMDHQFVIGAHAADGDQAFRSPEYPGGRLDWSDFDGATVGLGNAARTPSTAVYAHFLPNHVTFRGMPINRFWEFEDGATDYSQVNVSTSDLARMIVAEFTIMYGGNWFQVPVSLPVGSVSKMSSVVVTDTFGIRTLVRPTAASTPAGQAPWSMFTLTGDDPGTDRLLLIGTPADMLEGNPIEAVDLFRDDQAAMAWGVERTVPGSLDQGVEGKEAATIDDSTTPNSPPARSTGGPSIYYLLGSSVPTNWFPLLAETTTAQDQFFFRRGTMGIVPTVVSGAPAPRGTLLSPSPLFIGDGAISLGGRRVVRRFRRARGSDGRVYLWIGRQTADLPRVIPSGLAFDELLPMGPPTTGGSGGGH